MSMVLSQHQSLARALHSAGYIDAAFHRAWQNEEGIFPYTLKQIIERAEGFTKDTGVRP